MRYFLGVDLGTSYFKAGIFDVFGNILGLGRSAVTLKNGSHNICELEVAVFWRVLRCCIVTALKAAKITSSDISAISYSSQANSFILLDKSSNPLTPIVLWIDNRVDVNLSSIFQLTQKDDFLKNTGLGIPPEGQSIPAKIEWIQNNQPRIWEMTSMILSISDYLTFCLTNLHVSDVSTSSMTGLLNIPENGWWSEALETFNIEKSYMPVPLKVGSLAGFLTKRGAEIIGMPEKLPLFIGGLDHHMVAIGAGLPYLPCLSESTGTVLACVSCENRYSPQKNVNIAQGPDDNLFFKMAFDGNGAMPLEWYQRDVSCVDSIPKLLKLAEAINPGSDGLIALPLSHKYPDMKGFLNADRDHYNGHYTRAILESTGFSLKKLVEKVDPLNRKSCVVPSGGGAQSLLWLSIKSNILNRLFLIPDSGELACKGAAMVCAVGLSYYKNLKEATEQLVEYKNRVYPNQKDIEEYKKWSVMQKFYMS